MLEISNNKFINTCARGHSPDTPLKSKIFNMPPFSAESVSRRGLLWRWRNSNYAVWIRANKNVHSKTMFDFHCRIILFCLWTQSEVTLLISANYHCNTSILVRTVNGSVWTVMVSMLLILWVISLSDILFGCVLKN